MKLVDSLENLSNACGVGGREEEVRGLMKELLKPNVGKINEDKLGNVLGVKKGKKDAPTVMHATHIDEIRLVAKTITNEGFLQFVKIKGIDDRIPVAQKGPVHTDRGPITGIVGSKPLLYSRGTGERMSSPQMNSASTSETETKKDAHACMRASRVISMPTRYIQGPASMLRLKDAESSVKLAVTAIKNAPKYF